MAAQKRKEADRIYRARVVIADCVGRGPSAIHGDGTLNENHHRAGLHRSFADTGLSITKIYTVSFVC